MDIRLVDVYQAPEAPELLYRLMRERPAESAIAHRRTPSNEVGVFILREFQRRGYARAALQALMRAYRPLPAIPAVRPGYFVANVNPANQASIALFTSLGGRHIANTYEL